MGKLEDAKRAAAEAAQRRAQRVDPSPPDRVTAAAMPVPAFEARGFQAYGSVYEDAPAPKSKKEKKRWARAPVVEGAVVREGPASLLNVRLKEGERAKLQFAADQAELPLSVWAREVLLREVGKWGRPH